MPIPERFRLQPASDDIVARMCDLCDEIEDADDMNRDHLLAQWHEHSQRHCDVIEFKTYWKAVDKESFVREALNPEPCLVDDVTYQEVVAIYEFVASAEGKEYETSYYLAWLEAQFPNSNMSDLIYWPDEWFEDASLFRDANGAFKAESELSTDQTLAYAMAKSQRKLADAPDVALPFPLP
ncbi:MAG: hypothetical protein K8T91_22430 [Planctomycetes bacterium]|nr:hypothetical protein [Planctomycetota bacterium]